MKKPEPINKHIVCSACGLEWEKHGEKPTLEKCVELLKAELATRSTAAQWQGRVWSSNPSNAITALPLISNVQVGKAQ